MQFYIIEVYFDDETDGEFGPFLDFAKIEDCVIALAGNPKVISATVIPSKSPEARCEDQHKINNLP